MKRYITRIGTVCMCGLFVLLVTSTLYAATVRVSWVANGEDDLAGYRVYYGTQSGDYDQSFGNGLDVALNSLEIDNLGAGNNYYFAVTAYDTSGNESAYSQEVSIAIPDDAVVPVDSDQDGIPDFIEASWGSDPQDPADSFADDDNDGVVNLVEYLAGTNPNDAAERPLSGQVVNGRVVTDMLVDIIAEVGEDVDVRQALELDVSDTITPLRDLDAELPLIDGLLSANLPGTFIYGIADAGAEMIGMLRVSVTDDIFAAGGFEPGSVLSLEDATQGITLTIGADALLHDVDVAIGRNLDLRTSAEDFIGLYEFDLLPFGLSLASPASVSVVFDYDNPVVERYDPESETWVTLTSSYDAEAGVVNFSTRELGLHRIYAAAEDNSGGDDPSDGDDSPTSNAALAAAGGGGGGGGGCFISSAGF